MRFNVPQFIEIEDKIVGPFTFKQFIYLAGGAGVCFILYNFISPFVLAASIMLPIAALSVALAFYKVNEKPFIFVIESAFKYLLSSKLYIWKKGVREAGDEETDDTAPTSSYVPKLSDSKLKDLSWSLDVLDVGKGDGGGSIKK